jgi:hypothetical protein
MSRIRRGQVDYTFLRTKIRKILDAARLINTVFKEKVPPPYLNLPSSTAGTAKKYLLPV